MSSHHTNFHQNRATGLDFLLHKPDASYAIFLIFKCQYRGVLFYKLQTVLQLQARFGSRTKYLNRYAGNYRPPVFMIRAYVHIKMSS